MRALSQCLGRGNKDTYYDAYWSSLAKEEKAFVEVSHQKVSINSFIDDYNKKKGRGLTMEFKVSAITFYNCNKLPSAYET
jgi:hypothetical protein